MEPFTRLEAVACPLPLESVDTDQLIPARFMSRPRQDGYGQFLLHDLRFRADGAPNNALALDRPEYAGARILVARRNFGSGSSREAAVYALADFGIRSVIAPSFGDIFQSNAIKNGLLPAVVTAEAAEALLSAISDGAAPRLVVDLRALTIGSGKATIPFVIDPVRRERLLNGLDDIDLTLRHRDEITAFRARRMTDAPWVDPTRGR